ncbi:MAG: Unknown protein [uncultured Sulfurovum sp.]|uniref:Uncharacterized protein n=1 Tax=uncultured Sulfurovum sp. TaxID=269237 RepID=A0A6S6TE19_9BACT|nr:MAG: Unknown protein [uncultured Sulfurovum sp.]
MHRSSIIIFGMVSSVWLIISCISLNVSKFYNELEVNLGTDLDTKPTTVLRDRNIYDTIEHLN